jgi:formate dehydrogenase subunit gamma
MMSPKLLRRYTEGERMSHWLVAVAFVLATLSGLALFHPSLFFLTVPFGGGQWSSFLHPFLGILMALGFLVLFVRLWRANRVTPEDRVWRKHMVRMLRGDKAGMPPAGQYNYAQKIVFWVLTWSLLVLLVTGVLLWRWLGIPQMLPIDVLRATVLLHAVSAVVLIAATIMHVYAAIWVKGTMRAMTRGTVTESWAKANHPQWHKEVAKER